HRGRVPDRFPGPGVGRQPRLQGRPGAQHAAAHRERHGHPVPVAVCLALGSQEAPARDEFGLARGQAARSGTSAKATPKPAHKAGKVTPHNLGRPNFAGYCQHIGHRTAELVASNAYGWRCTLKPSIVLKTVSVCAWTYHLSTSRVIDVSTNYYDPNAWQCWRINRDLGVLDVTRYCVAAGHGTSKLVANNAYGWQCTSPAAAVDTTAACDLLYHVTNAVSRFAVFSSPYYWQCWN